MSINNQWDATDTALKDVLMSAEAKFEGTTADMFTQQLMVTFKKKAVRRAVLIRVVLLVLIFISGLITTLITPEALTVIKSIFDAGSNQNPDLTTWSLPAPSILMLYGFALITAWRFSVRSLN